MMIKHVMNPLRQTHACVERLRALDLPRRSHVSNVPPLLHLGHVPCRLLDELWDSRALRALFYQATLSRIEAIALVVFERDRRPKSGDRHMSTQDET